MENQNQQPSTDQSIEQPVSPPSIPTKSKLPVLIIAAFIFLIIVSGGAYYVKSKSLITNQKACPEIARICKDGKAAKLGSNCTQTCPEDSISPTPISSDPTANPDQIGANWKTYTNVELGISFMYPLVVDDSHKGAVGELPNIRVLLPIDSDDIAEKNIFISYIKNWPTSSQENKDIKKENITVNNEKAVMTTEQFPLIGTERVDVVLTKNSTTYDFRILYKLKNKEKILNYLKQFLSTFKFTQ